MDERVELDVVLPHPPERVWRALTDSDVLAVWLLPNDFKPRIGLRFGFSPANSSTRIACRIVELEPRRRLAYTWREREEDLPDLVTWTLEPVEAGTRLRLEHVRAVAAPVASAGPAPAALTPLVTTTLWCGAAIRLSGLLAGGFVMGRAVPISSGAVTSAVSIRRVDSVRRGGVRCG